MSTQRFPDMPSDREWFDLHPRENQRLRPPFTGEVRAIIESAEPGVTGELPAPPGLSWQVRVVRIGRRAWRDLLLRSDIEAPDGIPDVLRYHTVTLGSRAVVARL